MRDSVRVAEYDVETEAESATEAVTVAAFDTVAVSEPLTERVPGGDDVALRVADNVTSSVAVPVAAKELVSLAVPRVGDTVCVAEVGSDSVGDAVTDVVTAAVCVTDAVDGGEIVAVVDSEREGESE